MTLCGYNEQMGKALITLAKSFCASLEEGARRDGCDIRSVLKEELISIPTVCNALSRSDLLPIQLFDSLNKFALSLFASAIDEENPLQFIVSESEKFVELLEKTEAYSQTLEQPTNSADVVANAEKVGGFAVQQACETIRLTT